MGGKRSDQIPMEPGSTDKKTLDNDEHTHEEDKQHLHTQRGKLNQIPERGENPELAALKEKRATKEK